MEEIKPGQLVCSLAGRDKGSYYLVMEIVDAKYVLVADGKRKTVVKPKKKNKLHLQKHDYIGALAEEIDSGKITDSRVSYILKEAVREKDKKGGLNYS